jgi:hypothetical protein
VVEALGPIIPDEGSSLNKVRAILQTTEVTAEKRGAQAEAGPAMNLIAAQEAAMEEALTNLLAVAQSRPEVRTSATLGDLLDRLARASERVGIARRAWEDSAAALAATRSQFPVRLLSHSRE